MLDQFNTKAQIAQNKSIKRYKNPHFFPIINSIYWRMQYNLSYYKRDFIKEVDYGFDANINKIHHSCYLQGFWQSEKYFKEENQNLKDQFTLTHPIDPELVKVIKNKENTIAIHIRRSDYMQTNSQHIVIPMEYYVKGIEYFKQKLINPNFIVFSDDINWVKQQNIFQSENFLIMDNHDPEIDLFLMSFCHHQIIANSTFSWWAAWLNNYRDKVIIAPKSWMKDKKFENPDLIPEDWIKL